MAIKYVKNEVVNMLWDAEGFFESKTEGFIAAVHIYEGTKGKIPVMFKDELAFVLLDPDTDMPTSREDLYAVTASCFKEGTDVTEEYEENYVNFANMNEYNATAISYYGLTAEDGEDILRRLADLYDYWATETVDGF